MAKKDFKKTMDDPAEQFITKPVEEIKDSEDLKEEKKVSRTRTPKTVQKVDGQGNLFDVPVKPDFNVIETKSRRLSLLMQPTVYLKVKAASVREGLSVNDYIHSLLEQVK